MNKFFKSLPKLVILVALASSVASLQLTAILKAREDMKKVLQDGADLSKEVNSANKNERILSLVHGTAKELNDQMGKKNPSPSARNLTPGKPRFLLQSSFDKKQEKKAKVVRKEEKKVNSRESSRPARSLKQVADKDSIVVQYEPVKKAKKDNIKNKGKGFFKNDKEASKVKATKDDKKKQDRKLACKNCKKAKKAHKAHKKHKKAHKKAHKKHKKVHKAHKKAHKNRNLKSKKERNLMQLPSVNEFLGNEMRKYNRSGY